MTKDKIMQAMAKRKELTGIYSGYSTSIPQIKLDIDRDKARTLNVPVNNVFQGLQIYLGGLQVNDFNLFGRTYKVMLQAEQDFRKSPESINDIYVRSSDNAMVPMSTVSKISMTTGPGHSAALQHVPHRGNQRRKRSGHLHRRGARQSWRTWPPKSFRRATATSGPASPTRRRRRAASQGPIFGMAMVFVFLVLAAQYESWAVPFSVLLGLPDLRVRRIHRRHAGRPGKQRVCPDRHRRADGPGRQERDPDRGVRQGEPREKGMGLVAAATEGAKLRFRPIMMTAFAFILGVVPLVIASGAGAAARVSIGIAVFAGMLMASTVGLFFIPMLYVLIQSGAYLVAGNRKAIQGIDGRASLHWQGGTSLMRCKVLIVCMTAAL